MKNIIIKPVFVWVTAYENSAKNTYTTFYQVAVYYGEIFAEHVRDYTALPH